jgi:hypothetical protein
MLKYLGNCNLIDEEENIKRMVNECQEENKGNIIF